jgi:hypothetical protein
MKKMVSNKVMRVATEEANYQEDMQHHVQKQITWRGTPFWVKHAAKKMLIKNVEDGIDQPMTKRQLWESQAEYQAFPYDFFCKRANKVQQKALGAPYWQYKRNKNRREQQHLETDKMRKNGLWVLRWKRWLTCLNKLLFPPSVCKKYILLLASGGNGDGGDRDGVVWGRNSHQFGSLLGRILDQDGNVVMGKRMDPRGVLAAAGCKMQGGWPLNCNNFVHPLCSKYY